MSITPIILSYLPIVYTYMALAVGGTPALVGPPPGPPPGARAARPQSSPCSPVLMPLVSSRATEPHSTCSMRQVLVCLSEPELHSHHSHFTT